MNAVALSAAQAHVEAVVARSGTSFSGGMRLLPPQRRQAMHAIYAFCREIDDIADEPGELADKLAALADWRQEIDRLYQGQPQRPTSLALQEPVRRYDLPKDEFLLLIEGMEMDAKGPIVAPDTATLLAYCRRVAGAVGILSMPVFGAPANATSKRFALAMGEALQLTNILRDVADDAKEGRLYLPRELLLDAGMTDFSPQAVVRHPAAAHVAETLAAWVEHRYDVVFQSLEELDWRTLRPALAMMAVYRGYLDKMRRRGWTRVGSPLHISKVEKLWIAFSATLFPPKRR